MWFILHNHEDHCHKPYTETLFHAFHYRFFSAMRMFLQRLQSAATMAYNQQHRRPTATN